MTDEPEVGQTPEEASEGVEREMTEAEKREALKAELKAELEAERRAALRGNDLEREIRARSRTPNADLLAVRNGEEPLGMRPVDEVEQLDADAAVRKAQLALQQAEDRARDASGRLGPDAVARGNVGQAAKIDQAAAKRQERIEAGEKKPRTMPV